MHSTRNARPAVLAFILSAALMTGLAGCAIGGNKYADAANRLSTPTLLMTEASKGHSQYVGILLSDGVDPNETGTDIRTLRLIASHLDDEQASDLLLGEGVSWSPFKDSDMTPLMAATTGANADIVAALLKMRANPNAKTTRGFTALSIAALEGNTRIVNMLLDGGAKVNAKTRGGATALMIAALRGDTESAGVLIQRGANVNTPAKNGWTPLLTAIRKGNSETAMLLLNNNADPNDRDKNGFTPLMAAASAGDRAVVETLLTKGAKTDITNNAGLTALALADQDGNANADIVELLKHAEAVQ